MRGIENRKGVCGIGEWSKVSKQVEVEKWEKDEESSKGGVAW